MANPELGTKQICPSCQTKFYDLGRRPAVCPKCGTSFDPEEAVRSRRARTRVVPDYESDEEVKATPKEAEGEEFEEADETPEIDQAAETETDVVDDEDAAEPAADPEIGVDFAEEDTDLEEAEGEDVPFLEEEDEDFPDDEIEHHPGEDHDER
ncbi:MAG: TIGR02300 family protein [Caulobacteraceae bacterium]